MRINNETKIGALTAVAVTLLILGFNFLKGKSLFKRGNYIYAVYEDTKGLMPSYPVTVNGYQIGTVQEIEALNKNLKEIVVSIKLKEDYKIPVNSIAAIKSNPLSSSSIDIVLGDSPLMLKPGDTLRSNPRSSSMFDELTSKVGPVADQVEKTLKTLDELLSNTNQMLDSSTKYNFKVLTANLRAASENITISSRYLAQMLNTEKGALAQSLNNVNRFTKNLADNNQNVSSILTNLEKTSTNLAAVDVRALSQKLDSTAYILQSAANKLNSNEGSLGALINDRQLYQHLNNTARSLNVLMDDIRVHPKRYVNINFSLFGSKKKNDAYLTAPLIDSVNIEK